LGPANRAVVVSPDSSEARSTWTFVVSIHTVFVADEEEDAAPATAVTRREASRDARRRGTRCRFPRSRPRAVVRPGDARGAPRALADAIAVADMAGARERRGARASRSRRTRARNTVVDASGRVGRVGPRNASSLTRLRFGRSTKRCQVFQTCARSRARSQRDAATSRRGRRGRAVRATFPERDGRVRHARASRRERGAESPSEGVRARRRRWRAPREEATRGRGRARGSGRGGRGRPRDEQGGEEGGEEGAESGKVGVAGAGPGRAGHRARGRDGSKRVGQPEPIGTSCRRDGALVLEAAEVVNRP